MKILRIKDLKQILEAFDASQPKRDAVLREEEFSYIGSISNYFISGQQGEQVSSQNKQVDQPIEKIRSIYVEAKNRSSDESSWLPDDLLERFCAVLKDKHLDEKSVAGRAILSGSGYSGLMSKILAAVVRQTSFEISMLRESDFSFNNVGFLWVLESLFSEISKRKYQMTDDSLSLVLQNLDCAVALVVSLMALDGAHDKQALKAVFFDGFNKGRESFVGQEQMLFNMFFHTNHRYLKPLHGIPAAIDMIAKSNKPLSVDDLQCLLSHPRYAHVYANSVSDLYSPTWHERFKNIIADITRKMQDRPQRAHSLGIIVKKLMCFPSGKLLIDLTEIEKLDDERVNAFAFMINKMSDKMRTSENLSILFEQVRSGDMRKISYLCNILEFFTKLIFEPENAFKRMMDNLPFAAQYVGLPKLLDDGGGCFKFFSPLHQSLDMIFVNPESANSRITSLASLQQEYEKFKNMGANHEMVPYIIEARDAIFKNPEIAVELSQRVCLQARNWDGCFPLTPIDGIVSELTQTQKVRHSPKLFAQQVAHVEDKSDAVIVVGAQKLTVRADW